MYTLINSLIASVKPITAKYSADALSRLVVLEKIADDYVNIIFMDTLCMNMDRHTNNYGVLRNSENGAIEKSAPNFDNNIALISRGYTLTQVSQNDLLITLWRELCENIDVDFQYPTLKKDDIVRIANSIEINVDKQYVVDFVYNRYLALTN